MNPLEISRRTVLGGALLGGSAALLAGCAQVDRPKQADVSPSSTVQAPITVIDQRGKTLVFDQPVKRVVTIPMPAASLLVAVDQSANHLVGMHNASWAAMQGGIMGEMFPNALKISHDIARNDFSPNVESIAALNPDVVVQWSDSPLTAPLENAGLKVIGLVNTGTQEDVDAWTTIFATILGKPDRAAKMKSRSDKQLKQIHSIAAGRTGRRPSILYFNRFTGGLKVAGNKSYNDFYIKLIGGTNPATGSTGLTGIGMVGVDVEQVLAWDPEIILLGNFDAAVPEDLYSNPVWKNASAVKSRQVYKVPLGGYRWDPPGQESPLMWHWLNDIAFPEKRSALRATVSDYYKFLYEHRPTAAQIDKILWTGVNGQSANYQQFNAA